MPRSGSEHDPPMTTGADDLTRKRPAPEADHTADTLPKMNAKEVIRMGARRREPAPGGVKQ